MKRIVRALSYSVGFTLALWLLPTQASAAAVSFNASSSASAGAASNTTVTSSITISAGSNIVLVANVGYYTSASGVTSTASFNGVGMTLLASVTKLNATASNDWLYYLVNPPTGTNVASATVGSAAKVITISLHAYNGVNQSTPFGAATTTNQTTNPAESATITTVSTNPWIIDGGTFIYTTSTTSTFTSGGSQVHQTNPGSTEAGSAFGSSGIADDKPATSTGNYTMQETSVVSANLAASTFIVAELKAAPTSTADALFFAGD